MEVPKHDAGQGTSLTHYVRNSSGTCGTTPAVTRTCASVKSQDRGGGELCDCFRLDCQDVNGVVLSKR